MFPLSIVKYLNIFKYSISRFCSGLIALTLNTFLFEGSEEGFHERVIITVTLSAHTDLYSSFFEQCEIALARILTSSIGVMYELGSWPPLSDRHLCRLCDQLLVS